MPHPGISVRLFLGGVECVFRYRNWAPYARFMKWESWERNIDADIGKNDCMCVCLEIYVEKEAGKLIFAR